MSTTNWINFSKFQTMGHPATIERSWTETSTQKLLQEPQYDKSALIKLIRKGVPDSYKGRAYAKVLQSEQLHDYEKDFKKALSRTYGAVVPQKPIPPTFGGRINFLNSLALSPEGSTAVEHVLCILAHDYPNLEYCPMLPAICHLLGHFAENEDNLLSMTVGLVKINFGTIDEAASMSSTCSSSKEHKTSQKNEKSFYFPASHKDFLLLSRAFGNLLYKNNRKLHSHIVNLHKNSLAPLWSRWLTDLFIDILPQYGLWRLLDLFIANGYMALFQFGIALLNKFKSQVLTFQKESEFNDFFSWSSPAYKDPRIFEEIFQNASKITIKKLDTQRSADHHPILTRISSEDLLAPQTLRYQRGIPKFITSLMSGSRKKVDGAQSPRNSSSQKLSNDLLATSTVIQSDYWIALWSWIPPQKRLDCIELIFTTREHGTHISTMYQLTENISPMILIIETMDGGIFGAYLSQPWNLDASTHGNFYGNGETFLFMLAPYAKMYPWIGRLESESPDSQISEESSSFGANLFVRSLADSLTIGGGGSEYGIFLEELLVKGETGHCKTFGNDPLTASKNKRFDIHTVEVFAFRTQ